MNQRQRRVLLQARKRPVVFKHAEKMDPKLENFLNGWINGVADMLKNIEPLPKLSKAYRRWEHNVEKALSREASKRDLSYVVRGVRQPKDIEAVELVDMELKFSPAPT